MNWKADQRRDFILVRLRKSAVIQFFLADVQVKSRTKLTVLVHNVVKDNMLLVKKVVMVKRLIHTGLTFSNKTLMS